MTIFNRVTTAALALLFISLLIPYSSCVPEENILRTTTLLEDLSSLNPLLGNSITDWWIFLLLYDRLTSFVPPDLHVEPWLAESWEVSSDGKVWTLHLVKDATWHDGTPFTSADVIFTIEYVKKYEISIWLDEVQNIVDAQAPDDSTVTITTDVPLANFPSYVMARTPIIPKHIWEKVDNPKEYANENPIGTGPFKFKEYKVGEYISFTAYDRYWKGKPHIDGILAKIAVPADVSVIEAKKGELDLLGIDVPYVKEVEADPNLKVIVSKGIYFDHLLINTKKYPFSLKEFRQALAYAIDKNRLIDRVLLGYGDPVDAVGSAPAFDYWYNPNVKKYPYDLEMAKQILDNLGFVDRNNDGIRETRNGTKLQFELTNLAGYSPYIRMGDVVSSQLAEIGVSMVNTPVEWATQSKKANERDFYAMVWGWTIAPEPAQYLGTFRAENPYWSAGEMRNQTFNDVFDAQKSEMSPEKRRAMIFQLEAILSEELPVIPIWIMDVVEAYRIDRFTNFTPAPMGIGGIYNKVTWLTVEPVAKPEVTETTTAATVTIQPQVTEVVPWWAYGLIVLVIVLAAALLVKMRKRT